MRMLPVKPPAVGAGVGPLVGAVVGAAVGPELGAAVGPAGPLHATSIALRAIAAPAIDLLSITLVGSPINEAWTRLSQLGVSEAPVNGSLVAC